MVGDATGTLMPRLGIANVCCTEQSAHESNVVSACAVGQWSCRCRYETFSASLTTPETLPHTGFRSGVQPSYPRIVTFTVVFAGTAKYVVWSNWPVDGFLMKYDTQSGRLVTVVCGVVIIVTSTDPVLCVRRVVLGLRL